MRPKSLWTCYLVNQFEEFHQIYNFGAFWDKDEQIRFRGQKIKGQGRDKVSSGQKPTFLAIL